MTTQPSPFDADQDELARMGLHDLQAYISRWADHTFGRVANPRDAIDRMNTELKELQAAAILVPASTVDVANELADVVICGLRMCAVLGLNFNHILARKQVQNQSRQWVSDGRGNGQHT